MKHKLLVLAVILLGGCNTTEQTSQQLFDNTLDNELTKAVAAQDYRLYATSGRRVLIPGLNNEEMAVGKQRCGIKFMKDVGDVIKSASQRELRKETVRYMTSYNLRMVKLCKSK
ncbi:MAG: hypothetical protein HRU25_00715 [Psychrobium sp.]|nr:hypothetical protein [Psychrobium sp.]